MDQISVNTPTKIPFSSTNTVTLDNSTSTETLASRVNIEILVNGINLDTSKDPGHHQSHAQKKTVLDV